MQQPEEETIERVVETLMIEAGKAGAQGWEVYLSRLAERSIEVKGREVYSHEHARTSTAAIRLLIDNRMGFSYATQLDTGSIRRAVEYATWTARCLDPDEHFAFPKAGGPPLPDLPIYDPKLPDWPVERKTAMARDLEAAALKAGRAIKRVRKAAYEELHGTVHLFNSNGLDLCYSKTYGSLSLMAVAEKGKDSENAWDFEFSSHLKDLSPQALGKRVARKAEERLGGRVPKTRTCPVVLENHVAAEFLSLLAPSFLVENRLKNKSLWKESLGETILSRHASLTDSGRETRGSNAAPFDAEGTTSRRTVVVERGVHRAYLADTYWANKSSRPVTGNSKRPGPNGQPQLAVTNFLLEPGGAPPARLVRECKDGILITEVIGLHTADSISGDFSLGAMGREIVRGRLGGPLRGFGMAGNLKTLYRNVQEVADDLKFMGSVGSPSLLISEMQISGN